MGKKNPSMRFYKIAIPLSLVAVGAVVLSMNSVELQVQKATGSPYTLTLNSSNAPALSSTYNTTALATSTRSTTFNVLGAIAKTNYFCELESGASNNYIQNVDAAVTPYGITGLSAISVSYSGGDALKLYAAYSQSDTYYCVYEFSNASSKTTLSYAPFRFFKFVNESGSVIDISSITFTYSCATSANYISISAATTTVNVKTSLSITYSGTSDKALTFYYYDDNILIAGDSTSGYTVEGMLANTYTEVVAYNSEGLSTSFFVTVSDEYYDPSSSSSHAYYDQAGWRTATASLSSNGATSSFAKGIDVSEVQYDEECGAKYYNRNYKRQDVYQLLKDNGTNSVRIRVWVNPYTTANTPVAYGGSICDTAYVTKMAVRANRVGLKVMIDFHLSDFWTHPSQSVLPKAWASYTSTQIAAAIKTHVTSVLTTLGNAGVTPSMVQIGNEVSDGLYISYPTSTNASTSYTGDGNPYYIQNKSDFTTSSTSSAYLWQINSSTTNQTTRIKNFRNYLAAGCAAVRSYNSSIKIAIHYAKDLSSDQNFPATWFNNYILSSSYGTALDFDIVGLSYYPYYHGTIANLATAIANIKAKSTVLANKQYMVLETSFPFTTQYQYESNAWTSNTYPTSSSDVTLNGYSITSSCVAVQAKYYNDLLTQLVSSGANGMFIWAGCWIPETGCGWAGSGTKNTWANQGLFTYGGYLTSTLGAIYNQ